MLGQSRRTKTLKLLDCHQCFSVFKDMKISKMVEGGGAKGQKKKDY